jgi:hypothetical protein
MSDSDFYIRYYQGHYGKWGHEFIEFEFRPDGRVFGGALWDRLQAGQQQAAPILQNQAEIVVNWASAVLSTGCGRRACLESIKCWPVRSQPTARPGFACCSAVDAVR